AQGGPLTLDGALALARDRNSAFAVAAADVRRAEATRREARGLYGPRVGADGLYLRFQDPPSLALAPGVGFSPLARNGYLLQVGVLQPLYTGGRVGSAL